MRSCMTRTTPARIGLPQHGCTPWVPHCVAVHACMPPVPNVLTMHEQLWCRLNRAACHSKLGQHADCIADCDAVLDSLRAEEAAVHEGRHSNEAGWRRTEVKALARKAAALAQIGARLLLPCFHPLASEGECHMCLHLPHSHSSHHTQVGMVTSTVQPLHGMPVHIVIHVRVTIAACCITRSRPSKLMPTVNVRCR